MSGRFLLPLFLVAVIAFESASAHQPVMDMAPRWNDGYGFQLRHESYGSGKLLAGSGELSNSNGLERHVNKTWLEGIYTFNPSKRITFKLPYVEQRRVALVDGQPVAQSNSGLGDLILAMPLKRYTNKGANTSNWGITPQIRLPTGSSSGDFAISDGSVDLGLSVSYSAEGFPFGKDKPSLYQLYDLFYWYNREGDDRMREGDVVGLDINLGLHPIHNNNTNSGMYLMWDVSARHTQAPNEFTRTTASGGKRVHSGPVLVLYRGNMMFRAEYKLALYEKVDGLSLSRGDEFTVGIGWTF
ncbi:transporter [Porticoccus sp. W117]|uniref:transporter n=1 Tax=Porticoccus sp. W117 TaxID=3054777 RepID=UPI002597AC30|nr:transporter [Porticoccus sp. W117]MDM3870801.1 transporter [Porticoccus sp. W117]